MAVVPRSRSLFCRPVVWLVVSFLVALGVTAPVQHAMAAARPASPVRSALPLLLVHGYSDSCRVFTSTDTVSPGSGAVTAVDYLHSQGYPDVRTIGYYQDGAHTTTYHSRSNLTTNDAASPTGDCFVNVRDKELPTHANDCANAHDLDAPTAFGADGFTNDSVEYLGCLFAWYVHDVNTNEGTAVDVVAHSMGGLVVRSALAFSVAGNTRGYPTTTLKVRRVITVATPHLGLTGTYAAIYNNQFGSQEVSDMTTCAGFAASCEVDAINQDLSTKQMTLHTSPLMTALKAAGLPRGGANAYWALMGSSTQCAAASSALTSCINFNQLGTLNTYRAGSTSYDIPDSDGVVNADSQMGMAADYKIMYGGFDVNTDPNNFTSNTSVPAQGTVYAHEANSCVDIDNTDWTLNLGPFGSITIPTDVISPRFTRAGRVRIG